MLQSIRAKIALADSLSKIIPSDLLYGMKGFGKQGRCRRWTKTVLQRMSVTVADGKVQALLAPSDLLLSEGPYSFGVVVDTPAIAEGKLTMNVTYNSNRYVWMHSIFVGTVTAIP